MIKLNNIFVNNEMVMKELINQDENFKEEYLATKESILIISMTILAFSAVLIALLIKLL